MRVFKTKRFAKWARKNRLSDETLLTIVDELHTDNTKGALGNHVYKRRVALPGRGRRGGARTILAFKVSDKAFFIFGYPKNELATVSNTQLRQLKIVAKIYLNYTDNDLEHAINNKELIEVKNHE